MRLRGKRVSVRRDDRRQKDIKWLTADDVPLRIRNNIPYHKFTISPAIPQYRERAIRAS